MKDAGRKVLQVKCVFRLGDATTCLHVMTPFFKLVDMKDHMCKLLPLYAALSAAKNNNDLKVVNGAKIREVPAAYLDTKK